ncbi:murein tripeptide amidase MpaA [bacterium]|nr:murein tripeptide amidase MpaA [bacterium]
MKISTPSEYGPINYPPRIFGGSVKGSGLEIYESTFGSCAILILGSIHGDESLTTVLLSESLRTIKPEDLRAGVILSANPDGVIAGTRCNANGVDLNRNYPTGNWSPEPVFYRNQPAGPQNVALSPGAHAGSEPETVAMIELIGTLKPRLIVSLHGFLACIDDPHASQIARDISQRTGMDLVPDVGYSTPGSLGSWCLEQNIHIITYEFPAAGIIELRKVQGPVIKDLMTGYYNHLLPE